MNYIIATRGSKLALCQAEFIRKQLQNRFPQHSWELQIITTTGDRILDQPLTNFGGKGVFLKEIEEALLSGKAHLAVHSLKDVPSVETPGLHLAAFWQREDPRDVWCSYQNEFMYLPARKRIGTSSLRRKLLIQYYRPDLQVDLLRGNLDTRLRKLKEGQYDAIVVAAAGLHRLDLFDDSYMHYLSEQAFIPAIGQGILVVQTVNNSGELTDLLKQLNDENSKTAATIERSLLARFEGGCNLPIGALAKLNDQIGWSCRAFIGGVRSHRIVEEMIQSGDPAQCSALLYERLMDSGAAELLAELNQS